jgi:hypothetical protein
MSKKKLCSECESAPVTTTHEWGKLNNMCTSCGEFYQNLYENARNDQFLRKEFDYNQPQVSGFIVMHSRATDTVCFGVFPTLEAVDEWMSTIGRPAGVSGYCVPLINPQAPPEHFWWIPPDVNPADLTRPISERTDLTTRSN